MTSNKCIICSVLSGKGGVGKTTLISNAGAFLAAQHKHVLFIDLDYQANLTSCFNKLSKSDIQNACIIRAYKHDSKNISSSFPKNFKPAHVNKYIDILTANNELSNVSNIMRNRPAYSPFVIMHVLSALKATSKYDYVLIDCHNSFGTLSRGALVVSDKVVTPVTPSRFGISAVATMIKNLNNLKSALINPMTQKPYISVKVPLFVGSIVDFNTKESHQFESQIKKSPLFVAMFHRRVVFSRATTAFMSVFEMAHYDLVKKHRSNNQKAVDNEIKPEYEKLIKSIDK